MEREHCMKCGNILPETSSYLDGTLCTNCQSAFNDSGQSQNWSKRQYFLHDEEKPTQTWNEYLDEKYDQS